jgi:mannose/fructose/N-acetylgalactosamine-specific phosphotransferase system component IIB
MGVVLFRLDERLIHGQVVVAWGSFLKPDRIVIFNDQVAASPWERELYMCCVPPDFQASIYNLEEAVQKLSNGTFESEKVIGLVENLEDILELKEKGVRIPEVNLGGVHYSRGREKILPYLYLSSDEQKICRELINSGVKLYCQDVPTAEKKDLKELLDKSF